MGDHAPSSESLFEDCEEPDFVLPRPEKGELGIEFSTLYHRKRRSSGLPLRQEQGIQDSICRKLEAKWMMEGIPHADASIDFLGDQFPLKREEWRVVDALLSIIRDADCPFEETVDIGREQIWEHPVLGKFIRSINVSRWNSIPRTYVHAHLSAFLPSLDHDFLSREIAKKNIKCPTYRKKCEEVWLVLVWNEIEMSTHFDPKDLDLLQPFGADFDRLWLLDTFKGEVIELQKE
jgi:hypothetical protein